MNTAGDGNCGLYCLLDQLNMDESPMFAREDDTFVRYARVLVLVASFHFLFFRKYVITEMKASLRKGIIDPEFFCPTPAEYFARMLKNYTFIDNLFIKFFASLTGHDVVILPVHPESAAINKEFTWVFGIIVSDLNVLSSPLFCRWKSDE